jgi:hypothetical protein
MRLAAREETMRTKNWLTILFGMASCLLAAGCSTPVAAAATVAAAPAATPAAQSALIEPGDPDRYCLGTEVEKTACSEILSELQNHYGIVILVRGMNIHPSDEGYAFEDYGLEWTFERAESLKQQIDSVVAYFGGADRFQMAFGILTQDGRATGYHLAFVRVTDNVGSGRSHWNDSQKRIHLSGGSWRYASVTIHEMGHAWASLNGLEDAFLTAVGGSYTPDGTYVWDSALGQPATSYGSENHREDLAEAFVACLEGSGDERLAVRCAFIESNARLAR